MENCIISINEKGKKAYAVKGEIKPTTCWFSHWDGNSYECSFLFEEQHRERNGFKIVDHA